MRRSKSRSTTSPRRSGQHRLYERAVDRQQIEADWVVFMRQLNLRLEGASIDEGLERLLRDNALPSIKKLVCF